MTFRSVPSTLLFGIWSNKCDANLEDSDCWRMLLCIYSSNSFEVHSGSLNFRALLSDLLLLVYLLWHQLTQQLPFPRDNSGDNNGEKFFQSNIWIYLWHLGKNLTLILFKKVQIERIRICERFEIGPTMIVVMKLCFKVFSCQIF